MNQELNLLLIFYLFITGQWRIQDFPGEAPTYYLAKFSRKLHENEEMLARCGGAHPSRPLVPPLQNKVLSEKFQICDPNATNLLPSNC